MLSSPDLSSPDLSSPDLRSGPSGSAIASHSHSNGSARRANGSPPTSPSPSRSRHARSAYMHRRALSSPTTHSICRLSCASATAARTSATRTSSSPYILSMRITSTVATAVSVSTPDLRSRRLRAGLPRAAGAAPPSIVHVSRLRTVATCHRTGARGVRTRRRPSCHRRRGCSDALLSRRGRGRDRRAAASVSAHSLYRRRADTSPPLARSTRAASA